MPRRTLPVLFRSWAFKPRKHSRKKSMDFIPRLEDVEERLAPATLPVPTVITPTAATASIALPRIDPPPGKTITTVDYINPQVVADPGNPLHQVLVATSVTTDVNGMHLGVVSYFSSNGGQTWATIANFGDQTLQPRDPALAAGAPPNASYTNTSSASVAIGRDGTVYFVYLAHNATKTTGAVLFTSAGFGGTPAAPTILYQWNGADSGGNPVDPALNPVISVDNNVPTFTDPQTNITYTDPMVDPTTFKSKVVYVAWNGNTAANLFPGDVVNPTKNYNPNPILAAVSSDDGATWSNPIPVTDGGYLTSPVNRGAAPQIAFSPGTSGAPGSVVFVWPNQVQTKNFSQIVYDTAPSKASVYAPDGATKSVDPTTGTVPAAVNPVVGPLPAWTYGNATIPDAALRSQGTATATAAVSGGSVTGFNITFAGYGYPAPPAVTFANGGGSGAAATAVINAQGQVTGFIITNPGTGYTSAPTVTIAALPANPTADVANSIAFPLVVGPASTDPAVLKLLADPTFSLSDLSVAVSIVAPNLTDMSVRLYAPNGNSVLLMGNRIDGDGNAIPTGNRPLPFGVPASPAVPLPQTDPNTYQGLGVVNGARRDTVFNSDADRRINDPNNVFPFIGVYRPQDTTVVPGVTSIAQQLGYDGVTAAGLKGTWYLVITETRNDRFTANNNPYTAPAFLDHWSLKFTSGARSGFGLDTSIAGTQAPSIGTDFNNAPLTGTPAYPGVASTGLPPAVSIAFDTSLGSFSPHAGTLYVAYTGVVIPDPKTGVVTDTNINLAAGTLGPGGTITFAPPVQVNDDSAFDNLTQGNRPQFTPAVTVDSTTGTVVVTWYDTRLDANGTRAATFIATSIDGGATFSSQYASTTAGTQPFLNQPKNALDIITGTTYTLQPVPTNVPLSSVFGLGIRQSVIASGGNIYAYWAGNSNAVGSGIFSAHAVTAAGPRVISGDMGPVTRASSAGGVPYNTTVAADGTRQLDGFTITFDRPVDPATITTFPYPIQIRYHNPYDPVGTNTIIPVTGVTAIDTTFFGATTFLIRFAPQSKVGTYSYVVGPTVRDRVRTVVGGVTVTGNQMDQNANTVTGEANVDDFAVPTPLNGVPFTLPYAVTSEPLIIPGPYVTGSSVPNGTLSDPHEVLAGVASAVDVTFDRDMNANPASGPVFGPGNVVRLTGPAGVIYDRATAAGNPLTVTRLSPRNYRIGFPAQVLSGTYTVEIDPQFAAATGLPGGPVLVDTNQNAGVDVLRGTADPNSGVASNNTYSVSFNGTTAPPAAIPAKVGSVPGTAEFPITIADAYVITVSALHQVQVQLNVSSTGPDSRNVTDLTAELVAPDGTTIRLFTGVGNPLRAPSTVWFSNTILSDDANTPIQQGFQPFDSGPYNPQFALDALNGKSATGTWKLRIINNGPKTPNLTSWALILPKVSGGTGLGEAIADRISVSFRVFNQNPTDPLTQKVWTPVGPAAENGQGNSARTTGLAVDPSDPSGNTVFLGGASGGVWKTTNFLTSDPGGPTWVPLTDSGPTFSLNVVSIAVFGRNNDPAQSIVFALTGEGDTGSPGVGVLRSMDGGKTWVVLDSANNADTPTVGGNITPITAASRKREFFGATQFKIVVDPAPVNDADHDVIVYLAGSAGVWRSADTGRHWTQIRAGTATDIVLAAGSAGSTGNLQILYAAFQGDGIYIANPAYVATSMSPLTGTPGGNGSFIDGDLPTQPRVPIAGPVKFPNGSKGRIVLAAPALTGVPLEDINYQGWLYALVITAGSSLDGLYLTKDFGQNWTKVSLAEYLTLSPTGVPTAGFGTNNYLLPDHDPFAAPAGVTNPLGGQGNYDVAMAIDPLNPNVVYIGGTNDTAIGPNGAFIRVDTTGIMDALAVVAYDNGAKDGGTVQFTTNNGNVVTKPAKTTSQFGAALGPGQAYGVNSLSDVNTGYLNVLRNPDGPFVASSPLFFTNVASIRNTGYGSRYAGFPAEVETDVHRIITFVDQTTHRTRLIVGDDQGVASVVDDGSGNVLGQLGSGPQSRSLPGNIRNGNLQTVQFYSSIAQPGQLAAEIAGAMFYGEAQDDGFPVSNSGILQTGDGGGQKLTWNGPGGDGSWILADQTGSGTVYDYKWPCCGGNNNEFFQVDGVGRTLFLIQPGDNPTTGAGQWPRAGGIQFAVNPVDRNGLAISSPGGGGRLFRSTDQGKTWFVAGGDAAAGTTPFDGTPAPAIAFGAPDPANPNQLDNFIYAGTNGGHIYVTFKGGGGSWTDISNGLSGGGVQEIVPDPVRGTKDAFAVTGGGVFYMADSSSPTAKWVNITGNLFTITKPIFSDPNPGPQGSEPAALRGLTSIAPDWRYAIPVDPTNPSSGTFPILYAGGDGGVFRSLDDGKTWQIYPQGTAYTYTDPTTGLPASVNLPDGGYLPAVNVTQLTLSLGNIDPATGQPLEKTGGLNLLTAATYGRGTWVIRLGTPANDPAVAALAKYQVVKQSGPQVIGVDVTGQPTGGTGTVRVEFNGPVLASSFTTGQIQIKDAAGNPLTITGVTPLGNPVAPAAFPTVPGTPADYHNLFQVTFAGAASGIKGFGQVVIGPNIADYAGFFMDQNNNGVNGEAAADPNNGGAAADAYHGYLYFDSTGTGSSGNLNISMPVVTTAGAPTKVIVSDLNPNTGLPNAGYTGTISLTATINGRQVVLTNAPVVGLLTLSEAGNTVTATTDSPPAFAPGQTVTIAGVTTGGYNGTFVIGSVSPTGFTYTDPVGSLPGDALGGGTATGPLVPVAAQSGTPTPVPTGPLPATYTFTAADKGTHVFTIFFLAASSPPNQTLLSVTDMAGSPPNAAQAFITVTAGQATQFIVGGPGGLADPVTAGTTNNFTVTAADPYGNADPTYTGTVTLTTTDPKGTLVTTPYKFTSGTGPGFDNGVHVFQATLDTAGPTKAGGPETITATDATNPLLTLTGSQTVTVLPAAAASVTVTGFPAPVVAGTAGTFTVTLNDKFGNIATGYTGTVTFTSDDPFPATFAPPSYTFTGRGPGKDNGAHTFTNGATLFTAGTRSITATDAANSLAGTLTPITVVPAATAKLLVTGFPNPVVAGTRGSYTVSAADQFGNTTPAYTGTVAFSTTDPLGTFSPPSATYTFVAADNGAHTFTNGATLKKAGTWAITAADAANSLTGSETGIVVTPAAASTLTVAGFPTPVVAGTPGSFTLTMNDPFGNVATGYRGTVRFSSTDPLATFAPTTYPFVAADNGVKTFAAGATLRKAGTWAITATDTTTGTVTGSETGIVVTPAATSKFAVGGFPSPVVAGVPGLFTVTAEDQFGNTTPTYTGTATFSTTDPLGSFSPTSALFVAADNGVKTFAAGATLRKAGTWAITATDAANSLTGSETGIVVNPAAAATLAVTGFPTPVTAGVPGTFTVTLTDPFGNVAT
ncbi:MAG: Phage neck protein, partial [Gemmataceae bacterium]|nr:Phage neck protein [Gemmataceae bacterium]